jgi:arylformamidase
MKVVDLTQTITSGMSVYPGDPPITITQVTSLDREGFTVNKLELNSQVGTHVETQSHVLRGRLLTDEPLDRFIGKAAIVAAPRRTLTIDDLLPAQSVIERNEFLVLKTGYRASAVNPRDVARAFVDEPVARWIAERGVRLFGIDAFGFDPTADLRVHKALLRANVLIVEGLTNLDELTEQEVWLFVIPLKIEGVEASPCRAFALVGAGGAQGDSEKDDSAID